MSWDHKPDHFASSSSSSHPTRSVPPPPPLPASSRNNLGGRSAHERHRSNLAIYDRDGSKAREKEKRMREEGKTDWDVLREEHRFIRDDDNDGEPSSPSYGEAVARKLESQMFKEYALIDLKHYKSGKIALRWRTPQEVISSLGSSTCGSLRCPFHNPSDDAPRAPPLQTFELPFAYIENNEPKSALVKVVLCDPRCRKKLFWGKEGGGRGGGEKESERERERSASPRRKEGRSRSRSPERRERKEKERRR